MRLSNQRLGDNPKDHDGVFPGINENVADVCGVRPDSPDNWKRSSASEQQPWRIYPKPPPPHWHWMDRDKVAPGDGYTTLEEFDFVQCEIPERHEWDFELDESGVYQVFEETQSMSLLCLSSLITLHLSHHCVRR